MIGPVTLGVPAICDGQSGDAPGLNGVGQLNRLKITSSSFSGLLTRFEISQRPPVIIPATAVSAHHKLDADLGHKLRAGYDCLFRQEVTGR
jgi:hypothetical protein